MQSTINREQGFPRVFRIRCKIGGLTFFISIHTYIKLKILYDMKKDLICLILFKQLNIYNSETQLLRP